MRKSVIKESLPALVSDAPTSRGIYRFYSDQEIIYIGASRNLLRRIDEHINGSDNELLREFIESGGTQIEWYSCPYPGWMERYELFEFEALMGRRPVCNKIDGGLPY